MHTINIHSSTFNNTLYSIPKTLSFLVLHSIGIGVGIAVVNDSKCSCASCFKPYFVCTNLRRGWEWP